MICFKSHKIEHDSTTEIRKDTATVVKAHNDEEDEKSLTKSSGTGFAGLETDTDLQNLLKQHDGLRLQIQSVYGMTLEPDPSSRRAYGSSHGRWTQAKGDSDARGMLRDLREGHDNEGIEAFIALVAAKKGQGGE